MYPELRLLYAPVSPGEVVYTLIRAVATAAARAVLSAPVFDEYFPINSSKAKKKHLNLN